MNGTTSHPLVGATVRDTAVVGGLVGRITAVAADGLTVGITWAGRIGVSWITPDKSGRFVVEVPA
jgi:hypothetical protein